MNGNDVGSVSLWHATYDVPMFPSLNENVHTDVCVIGAGIAGLTAAYLLSKEGRTVTVIDAVGVGAGETGRTTAHFFPPDERYFQIENRFGSENAVLVANAFRQATDLVERIILNEGIQCGFSRLEGYLYARTDTGVPDIEREFHAAVRAGVDVQLVEQVPGMRFTTGPAVCFRNQAQFHPMKYLGGLAAAITRQGGRIYGGTRAVKIVSHGSENVVQTGSHEINASSVIVATNTPFNDRVVMHTKQSGYQTYVLGLRVMKGSIPRILLWDTGDPYYYVRLESPEGDTDHDILVIGGEDHKVGQDSHPEHRYKEIEAWARAHFPGVETVTYRWSGEVMEPADGLPFLGRNPVDNSNVYIITGDSGNGMTHCTAGAKLITDLIQGRPNEWSDLYAPSRKPLHGISTFLHEQANTLKQYGALLKADAPISQRVPEFDEGAVVESNGKKLAVYREADGQLHARSAICTHLGCVVAWNSAEKSWDCPCHGSRFNVDGEVLHGPAVTPLAAVSLDGLVVSVEDKSPSEAGTSGG
ncbi:FAD-dependent oxidoreductase [Herbaspirillum sp. GCM10030257]|uniref:FAD-dependent oxidoreductase n=1 Tax=Herbaspirillum sp. GCM10030257 TaxID=3273393 RepID=UPI0036183FCB